jgi:hypothetical protein
MTLTEIKKLLSDLLFTELAPQTKDSISLNQLSVILKRTGSEKKQNISIVQQEATTKLSQIFNDYFYSFNYSPKTSSLYLTLIKNDGSISPAIIIKKDENQKPYIYFGMDRDGFELSRDEKVVSSLINLYNTYFDYYSFIEHDDYTNIPSNINREIKIDITKANIDLILFINREKFVIRKNILTGNNSYINFSKNIQKELKGYENDIFNKINISTKDLPDWLQTIINHSKNCISSSNSVDEKSKQ